MARANPVSRFASAKPLFALALLSVTGFAAAAIALSYTTSSTVTTSVIAAPVQFVAGGDAGPSTLTNYVTAYSISTNKTYITATVKGVPESTLTIGSVFQLLNTDATNTHTATLSTSQVTNTNVTAYTMQIYNPSNVLQGTLDLKAAGPTVTFTIPTSEQWYAKLTLTLAAGAGADNVALSTPITLTTS